MAKRVAQAHKQATNQCRSCQPRPCPGQAMACGDDRRERLTESSSGAHVEHRTPRSPVNRALVNRSLVKLSLVNRSLVNRPLLSCNLQGGDESRLPLLKATVREASHLVSDRFNRAHIAAPHRTCSDCLRNEASS